MKAHCYTYAFGSTVSMDEVEDSLMIAAMAVEGLHGRSCLRLETDFALDRSRRECWIQATTEVGRDLARVFTSLLSMQVGEKAFDLGWSDNATPIEHAP